MNGNSLIHRFCLRLRGICDSTLGFRLRYDSMNVNWTFQYSIFVYGMKFTLESAIEIQILSIIHHIHGSYTKFDMHIFS